MGSELSYEEAREQWQELEELGWGNYWHLSKEPRWAVALTKTYGAAWREVAYQRIARAFLNRIRHLDDNG